jgi:ribonucleotide reductase alpha subunit
MTSPSLTSYIENCVSTHDDEMYVTKRDGKTEIVSFDKILQRIKRIGKETDINVNYTALAMKVIDQLFDGISTTKIDELSAEQCASMASIHYDYNTLAGRIIVSNHQKNTSNSFSEVMEQLYGYLDKHGKPSPIVSEELITVVRENKTILDLLCDYSRDYLIDYFGFKTLDRAYMMKIDGKTVERPQHMWLRVSIGIHGDDFDKVVETYDYMSQKYFTHATPTLFNSGTPRPQLSSCFLLAMESDSIDGIYNTLKDCALISKLAGGIGLHIHNVRATGSHIRGTNGTSNGIVPMLRVFNNTAKYVDQCLDPETIVYTKQGAKKIKNIVIGDKVITDDGQFYQIGKILDNEYYGDLYTLNIKHTLYPLKLTDMHPLWTIKNDTYYQRKFNDIINQLNRNLLTPEFIEVKNINKNDLIGFPIPKYEKDIEQYTLDDCRFYGIMLGDGNISRVNNLAYVALDKEVKKETVEFVENYLTSRNIHITYTYQNDKYVRLTWTRNNMFKFTYEMLYDSNREKYVMASMLHLPKPKILNLIKGILETDGKVKDYQIVLEITSMSIVESVRYMLLRLGILTSGTVRDRRDEVHTTKYNSVIQSTKVSYILIVPKKPVICDLFKSKNLTPSSSFTFFEYKDYLFSMVIENTCIKDYSGRVIDIEVDNNDHHNFLTHNGLVKNGGGKRNGSFAIYLEPWHADIEMFLQMRKNHGDEELKARDLFYAVWIPDLFMERVKANGKWTLMCPDECPGLADVYGEEFKTLYEYYEKAGKGRITIQARDLWYKVMDAQMETGTPYLLYKDACNRKSNQKNVGTIKSSNLCVSPETLILTNNGHVPIYTLCDQTVSVWNGEEFSHVVVHKTGENQELIRIYFDNETTLDCTPYHKFYVLDINENVIKIEANDLKIGMKLEPFHLPGENITFIKIKDIINHERFDDTYCFTEPKRNRGTFNGIITGQCSEIVQYSDDKETAVCNLASIGLPTFIKNGEFDYELLHKVTKIVTKNLNKIIDVNYYPTEKTRVSNMRHRPIGIGVQGLADVFIVLGHPFLSDEAKQINRNIFETMYHAALESSCELAVVEGPYETFEGSPASKGELQFDMWSVDPGSSRYDWAKLKQDIIKSGLRNSLLLAPMPTASTSQILGFNECIEPITSNIYSRRTLAGEFIQANKYLMADLMNLNLWNDKIKNNIIANHGSIQQIVEIPQDIKDKYKTVWEMPMRGLIDMAADRGAFICQSQSLNLWIEDPNYNTLTASAFYSWSKGLKTGIYYLRRRGKHQAQQFTIEPEKASSSGQHEEEDICEMCSA